MTTYKNTDELALKRKRRALIIQGVQVSLIGLNTATDEYEFDAYTR